MLDTGLGPFLFDTSADAWFARHASPDAGRWLRHYLTQHPVHVSAITVFERVRGFALLLRRPSGDSRNGIEDSLRMYLADPGEVHPMDALIAAIAAEICALIPNPPTPPRRAHRIMESRQERLARWRNDTIIAATALATDMLLLHNNTEDFETIRGGVEREPERFPGLGPLKLMPCVSVLNS